MMLATIEMAALAALAYFADASSGLVVLSSLRVKTVSFDTKFSAYPKIDDW